MAILLSEAIAMVLVIGYLDYFTSWEMSLFVLYAVPILLAVWFTGPRGGCLVAILAAVTWWWANSYDNPYSTRWGYVWATVSRFMYFIFLVVGGAAMKAEQEASRARIEALERTRELEADIVRASEREQRRIGQDLHDGLCQYLAAVGCAAASLKEDLRLRGAPESGPASEIEELIRDAVAQARDLARGIFPVQMDEAGLCTALEELACNTGRLQGVNVRVDFQGDVRIPDPATSMHLYRIAQESIANSIRHGAARNIDVVVSEGDDVFMMTVTDDGAGITKPTTRGPGMGLKTMLYRAQLIGAQLEVANNPSGGVIVSCVKKTSAHPEKINHPVLV